MKKTLILTFLLFSKFSHSFDLGVDIPINNYNENSDKVKEGLLNNGLNSFKTEVLWSQVKYKNNSGMDKTITTINKISNGNDRFHEDLSPLIVLNYENPVKNNLVQTTKAIDDFINYVTYVASINKGKNRVYEILNQSLDGASKIVPSPRDYYQLIILSSKAIHKIDPSAKVIAGAVNPIVNQDVKWFDEIISMGVLNYIDGVSIHPYPSINSNPESLETTSNFMLVRSYEEHLTSINNCNPINLYITGMRVPSPNGDDGKSQNNNESFVLKYTLLTMSESYIKGLWWGGLENKNKELTQNPNSNYILVGLHKSSSLVKERNTTSNIDKNGNVTVSIISKANDHSAPVKVYWNDRDKRKGNKPYIEAYAPKEATFINEPLIVHEIGS